MLCLVVRWLIMNLIDIKKQLFNKMEAVKMNKIHLYSKPNCPQCDMTKFLLKNENIEFHEKNIMEDESHLTYLKNLGYMSVPVVMVEGIEPIVGFQPERLKELKAI